MLRTTTTAKRLMIHSAKPLLEVPVLEVETLDDFFLISTEPLSGLAEVMRSHRSRPPEDVDLSETEELAYRQALTS